MDNKELAERAGLADGGKDDLKQQLYIGTDEQWAEYEKLKDSFTVGNSLDRIESKVDEVLSALKYLTGKPNN